MKPLNTSITLLNSKLLPCFRKRLHEKKTFFFIVVCCLWGTVVTAQTNTDNNHGQNFYLPQGKYKASENTMYRRVKDSFKGETGLTFMYSYHQTNFLNDNFAYLIKNDELDRNFGSSFKFRIEYGYPFLFDVDWFSSRFFLDSPSGSPLEQTSHIRHRGLEVSCNLLMLPVYKYFSYYLGLGYQSASLIASNKRPLDSTKEDDPNATVEKGISYYSDCSSVIWKAGFTIMMGENYLINAEYKQSLKPDGLKSFNQLSVGLGIRPTY